MMAYYSDCIRRSAAAHTARIEVTGDRAQLISDVAHLLTSYAGVAIWRMWCMSQRRDGCKTFFIGKERRRGEKRRGGGLLNYAFLLAAVNRRQEPICELGYCRGTSVVDHSESARLPSRRPPFVGTHSRMAVLAVHQKPGQGQFLGRPGHVGDISEQGG